VDRTVLEKYDRVEKKETQLKQKLQTVKNDKSQIQSTLVCLDEKKLSKLNATFTKVNEY
jgi:structural maintenance of chromosome 2